jgi:hypothetical protein
MRTQLGLVGVARALLVGGAMTLAAAGAQATSMTLTDFVANGATVGSVTFSNASVSIKKGLNRNLDKYTVVVSDTGVQLLGKTNKPGKITLQYDVSGAS